MELTVGDLMTDEVVSVNESEDLYTAYELMAEHNCRHLPVTDHRRNLTGILSDRDLIRGALYTDDELPASDVFDIMKSLQVSEVMARDPDAVDAQTSIIDAGLLLLDAKLSSLPVVAGRELVGIITLEDFVKFVIQEQENE